jgi:hypothetical protein
VDGRNASYVVRRSPSPNYVLFFASEVVKAFDLHSSPNKPE